MLHVDIISSACKGYAYVNIEGYSKTFIERFLEQNVFCQTDPFGRTVSGKGLVLGSDKTEPCH